MGYKAYGRLTCIYKTKQTFNETTFVRLGLDHIVCKTDSLEAILNADYDEEKVGHILEEVKNNDLAFGLFEFRGDDDEQWRFQYYPYIGWKKEKLLMIYDTFQGDLHGISIHTDKRYPEIRINVNGGTLCAYAYNCGEAKQVGLSYIPNGEDAPIDLCFAEVKGDELAGKQNNQDIDVYLYEDPYTEDYTRKVTICKKDIDEAFHMIDDIFAGEIC